MTQEPFEIEHHGLTIRGTQYLPRLSTSIQQRVPTVVILHGFAGHRIGPSAMFVQVARSLNDAGIAAVTFDCRHSGESDGSFDQMLVTEELDDVLRVTQWVQTRPWVDRSRIGVFGFSLGGLLAANAIGRTDAYKAAILAAPTTVQNICRHAGEAGSSEPVVVGPTPLHPNFFTDVRTLDPLADLATRAIPALVVQGDADTAVPPAVSDEYVQALRQAGGNPQVELVPGADHSFSNPESRACLIRVVEDWLAGHL